MYVEHIIQIMLYVRVNMHLHLMKLVCTIFNFEVSKKFDNKHHKDSEMAIARIRLYIPLHNNLMQYDYYAIISYMSAVFFLI